MLKPNWREPLLANYVAMTDVAETKYARTPEGLSIAYQVIGDGPVDLVFVPGWISHIEWAWEYPPFARMLQRLSSFSRLIWFDRRGMGLSDRPEHLPTLEDQMEDIGTVMDAVGSEHASIFGDAEGGVLGLVFAATHPERVDALITFGGRARVLVSPDFPLGESEERVEHILNVIVNTWGRDDPEFLTSIAPSMLDDPGFRKWYSQLCRLSASPSAVKEILRVTALHDIRSVLPTVRVPTLNLVRRDGPRLEHVRYIASQIPNASLIEVPGKDVPVFVGDTKAVIDEVQEFLTGVRDAPDTDRVLSTVLMTDIVGSTDRAIVLGDRRWSELLDAHDKVIDRQLERFRGRKVNPTGDGMLATFDGPARAIRCAQAISSATREMGVEVRAGLHTGEIELRGDDVGGIGVHIGARVASLAGSGEILVSRTVTDLVAGSGIEFEDRGEYELKGVPGTWQLFAVCG
jgi:class 3 adenylate cyclase